MVQSGQQAHSTLVPPPRLRHAPTLPLRPAPPRPVAYFHEQGVKFGAAKAANAGGVAVSGLEMSQNRMGLQWTRMEVCDKLRGIMANIYAASKGAAEKYGTTLAEVCARGGAGRACAAAEPALLARGGDAPPTAGWGGCRQPAPPRAASPTD